MCIPESKVALMLKGAYNNSRHGDKDGTISKLEGNIY